MRVPRRLHPSLCPVAVAAPASNLKNDLLIQFQVSSGTRRLAVIVRPDGKRNWIVNDANGLSHSITAKQITFILGQSAKISRVGSSENLAELDRLCQQKAEENVELLQLVWENVASGGGIDDTNLTDVNSVADIIFGDTDPLNLYTTHLILSSDLVFFKERNIKGRILYEARTEAQVGDARLMLESQYLKQQERERRQLAFSRAYDKRSLDPLNDCISKRECDQLIECLKQLAAQLDSGVKTDDLDNSFQKLDERSQSLVSEALSATGMKIKPSAAVDVLVAWGIYSPHENLALINSGIPHLTEFDSCCRQWVDQLLSQRPVDLDRAIRTDLSHLNSYAIDSADTTEVDDAISWDPESDRVYVHIADPTRYFSDGVSNPLLQSVLRRVATLYLPDKKLTMFPMELATSLFSLDGLDADGCALSFGVRINDDGALDEESISITPSIISPPLRFTYDETERILKLDPENEHHTSLHKLYEKANRRKEWREMEGGAVIIKSSFSVISVREGAEGEQQVSIGVVHSDTKSWELVSELMITTCAMAASFAERNRIPVPFRGQMPFEYPNDEVLESMRDGPARAALAFKNATAPILSTKPMEHASLGLDSYLQVTSPIRRSIDLVAHFQLKACLRGDESPFAEDAIQAEIGRINDMTRTLRNIESRSKKYWQLEFLRREGPRKTYDVQYVRQLKGGNAKAAQVQFEDLGFQLVSSVPTDAKPGTILTARVVDVNPRAGTYRVEAMHKMREREKGDEDYLTILDDAFSDTSSKSEL